MKFRVNCLFCGQRPDASGYGASKAALNSCFNSLRLQYHFDNIGFVLVLPGPVATDMLKTPKPLPFTHQPADEAEYIVEKVFLAKQLFPTADYISVFPIKKNSKYNWLKESNSQSLQFAP